MSLAPLLLGVFKAVEQLSQVLSGGSFGGVVGVRGGSGVGRSVGMRWVPPARAGTGCGGVGPDVGGTKPPSVCPAPSRTEGAWRFIGRTSSFRGRSDLGLHWRCQVVDLVYLPELFPPPTSHSLTPPTLPTSPSFPSSTHPRPDITYISGAPTDPSGSTTPPRPPHARAAGIPHSPPVCLACRACLPVCLSNFPSILQTPPSPHQLGDTTARPDSFTPPLHLPLLLHRHSCPGWRRRRRW